MKISFSALAFFTVIAAALFFPTLNSSGLTSPTRDEGPVTGTLERLGPGYYDDGSIILAGEIEYRLKLDKPIKLAEGSKSERMIGEITLIVPAELREKADKLVGQHVVASGKREYALSFSPWTASCEMTVSQIDAQD